MRLSALLQNKDVKPDPVISGLTADSRTVKPGFLFAALPGSQHNGADYIAEALSRGAVAVLCRPDAVPVAFDNPDVAWIFDPIPARLFSYIAGRFFTPQPDRIAAVTGTNGKTSVAAFTQQIWEHMGHKAAAVGTLGIKGTGLKNPALIPTSTLTTPDPVTLHSAMSALCDAGIDHVVFEASSHGLAQYRLDGVNVSVAAFTNLSRDHYDYHGSAEEYFHAKARLFGEVLKPGSVAVLNADCPLVMEVADICWARGHRVIAVGRHAGDIRLLRQRTSETGQDITVSYGTKIYDLTLPLVGDFQALNALMAVGLVISSLDPQDKVAVDKAFAAMAYLKAPPGRMEQAGRHPAGARIYVDYAHTPDALETVLQAVQPYAKGRLCLVFGCGGDRDQGKRPIMGEIAEKYADKVYVTDDNPRGEDPASIRAAILAGCPTAQEIPDRTAAITAAVTDLAKGDILLVAGKGHEQGQQIAGETRPFDDRSAVRSALAAVPIQKKTGALR